MNTFFPMDSAFFNNPLLPVPEEFFKPPKVMSAVATVIHVMNVYKAWKGKFPQVVIIKRLTEDNVTIIAQKCLVLLEFYASTERIPESMVFDLAEIENDYMSSNMQQTRTDPSTGLRAGRTKTAPATVPPVDDPPEDDPDWNAAYIESFAVLDRIRVDRKGQHLNPCAFGRAVGARGLPQKKYNPWAKADPRSDTEGFNNKLDFEIAYEWAKGSRRRRR